MVGERDAIRLGEIGLSSLFGNNFLRLGGFLVVVDGSLSSLTGYMSAPYRDSSNNGLLLMDEEELYEMLRNHFSLYFWAALQCVGDGANEIALRVFKRIDSERGIPQLLKRIDFAQALKDEDINEFARSDIVAVIIPGQIPSDRENAMMYLGTEARLLFRTQSLLNAGIPLAFASNAPATPVNPLYNLYCAVERKRFDDGPEMRFYPRERIALIDAVYAYTMGSARACGFEKEVGSIEAEKFADLIHLSTDIFSNETDTLKDTVVQAVYVGGEKVYQRAETG
jgi:predicted amidohydrolase YtcJ